ncbi:patatin-like phospholipase family protein [Aureivirga sp. CE67]|uniref:patatin-like phospholipase family protein n=1 Tax=Aureivirga sp. CE67 TaxID=1788983 RepID=UPI0018CAF5AA|nr:patatin-like phospholipase family protein [Aureivirga sp. CE67]
MKKALVISGGGAKGAFAGGVAEYLIKEKKKKYDIYIGSSTGSLLVTHLALGKVDEIRDVFINVNQKSIFNNCPFKIKKNHGHKNIHINMFRVLWSLFRKELTFGQSLNLKDLIKDNIHPSYVEELKKSKKEVFITISNFTEKQIEFKNLRENSYDDYCDWVWGSCNLIPFMSVLEKNNKQYADGSFGSIIPIKKAILEGAKEVDVIILDTENILYNQFLANNTFSVLFQAFDFMMYNIGQRDINSGRFRAEHSGVKLNFYFTPRVLTLNPLLFDKEKMTKWWKSGYKFAEENYIK